MAQVVNNNKLNLILTKYGIDRIAYAVEHPTANLNITKIKLGSGNNHEYYVPDESQEELKGPLGLEFYIYDKALLEDGLTVSFHTIIPEDIGGFDIREVGLYEVYGGEEKLFAISTQQPFVKPSPDDFYFINIEYYLFLKAQNFAQVYDQITLDVEHALITDTEMEELIRTFLFAQSNLINQIGNNSTIIGYNRATQLYQKIRDNKQSYSYITLYKNYAALTDLIESPNSLFSYWAFEYSRRKETESSIVDLSKNGYYLSTNKPISEFERVYRGFTSMFTFDGDKSFNLSSQIPLDLTHVVSEGGVDRREDAPFSMIFVVEPLELNENRTLLAKSDYALGLHTIEVTETEDRALQVKLFSDAANYKTFKTVAGSIPAGTHVIAFSYFPTYHSLFVYINSTPYIVEEVVTGNAYKYMSEEPGILYAFECAPDYSIFADSPSEPTKLYSQDETGFISVYEDDAWSIRDNNIYYKNAIQPAEFTPVDPQPSTVKLYQFTPNPAEIQSDLVIYTDYDITDPTKASIVTTPDGGQVVTFFDMPLLYDENYHKYEPPLDETQDHFSVEDTYQDGVSTGFQIYFVTGGTEQQYKSTVHDPDTDKDIQPINVYKYIYSMPIETIYTNNPKEPTVLYTKDGERYIVYSGDEWTIEDEKIYKLGFLATRNDAKDGETTGLDLTSYIIGADGYPTEHINSNVGIISVIKEGLSDNELRVFALNLCAALGRNPYFGD